MGARSGETYIAGLRARNPQIYLEGRRIEHVTSEPVFAGPIRSIAEQYDLQLDPAYADICTFKSPGTGEPVSSGFLIPASIDELVKRRRHFKIRADHNFGFMGRSPDFMSAFITNWFLLADHFGSLDPRFGDNARNYYEYVRDNDLFMTHVLVNPQIDRARRSADQEEPFLHLGKVAETDEGIIVRGAKMLGTMAPLTDELVVVPFGGIAPGDDAYALVFSLPIDAPGLKFICRESVAPAGRSAFDHPLSSRFEEMDCMAIFDDVLVPWDRVLVDGRPGSAQLINTMPPSADSGSLVCTGARALAAMEFMCGVATKLAEAVGIDGFLHVQDKLGELLVKLDTMSSLFYGSEALGSPRSDDHWSADVRGLLAILLQNGSMYARAVEVIQILAGGGFFYAPTEADMANDEIRPLIDRYARGRTGVSAEERVALFKLAWDVTGDAFGQRMLQYTRYYSGDPIRLLAGHYLSYDTTALQATVDRALRGATASNEVDPTDPRQRADARNKSAGHAKAQLYPASALPPARAR